MIIALALVLGGLGARPRSAEFLLPCEGPDCLLGQVSAADHQRLRDLGLSPELYFWSMESLLLLVVVTCVAAALLLLVRRPASLAAQVSALFLVLVPIIFSMHLPALERAQPGLAVVTRPVMAATSIVVPLLFFIFPTGRLVPRWAGIVLAPWALLQLGHFVVPLPSVDTPFPGLQAGLILWGVFAQGLRYREASSEQRQQIKWIVYAVGVQVSVYVVALPVAWVLAPVEGAALWLSGSLYVLYLGTFCLIPVALVHAISHRRLWDIDLIINRSLVYGLLSVLLFAVFLGLSALGVALVELLTGARRFPLVMVTVLLLAGAAFQPARRGLQRVVDRVVYGIDIDYQGFSLQPEPLDRTQRSRPASPLVPTLAAGARDGGYGLTELTEEFGSLSPLGVGGMAQVFLGRSREDGAPVAIKIMHPELRDAGSTWAERLALEGEILRELNHPNVIRVLGSGRTSDGLTYLVTEYVSGGDLALRVRRSGALPLETAGPLLFDVASALDYLHARKIVHRDLKPSNVLLRPAHQVAGALREQAVLVDFGVAKTRLTARLTAQNLIGTLHYMAPEQVQDAALVDARADIYSFGALAFEVLAGRPPFDAASPTALLLDHLKRPAPDIREFAPEVPILLARMLARCLEKEPRSRPASALDVVACLGDLRARAHGS